MAAREALVSVQVSPMALAKVKELFEAASDVMPCVAGCAGGDRLAVALSAFSDPEAS